jgi:hypothetical protein
MIISVNSVFSVVQTYVIHFFSDIHNDSLSE